MRGGLGFVILFGMVCGQGMAQQAASAPAAFAVATIKPSAPDEGTLTQIRGNRFFTQGTTFVDLFKYAFDVNPAQVVGGPEWLRTKKFDVVADPETEKRPRSDEMKAMVQQLLVERFHVVMHRGQKVLPVYALVRTAEAPKLKESAGNAAGMAVVGYDPKGELSVGNATMANFATFLQRFVLDRPAVDQTGIPGRFDVELRWTPDGLDAAGHSGDAGLDAGAAPNLFTAIREQLGLKLEAKKAEAAVFVIERAEEPTED